MAFGLLMTSLLLVLPDCLPSPDTTRLASSDCFLARLLAVFTLLFSSLWLPQLAWPELSGVCSSTAKLAEITVSSKPLANGTQWLLYAMLKLPFLLSSAATDCN